MRVAMLLMLVACGGGESPPGGPACGPTTCGEGTVCCDHCVGSCVPENSGAQCPDDIVDPERVCSPQACGASASCDVDTEVCVGTGAFGPSVMNDCEPVVTGCEHDRTCDCLAELLCPEGTIQCTDVGVNEIFCDNGTQ